MPLAGGCKEILRKLYYYGPWEHISRERIYKYYDALYQLDNNIWVGYVERRLRTTTTDVVVEDIRYVHEANILKQMGFTLIRITSPYRSSPGHILRDTPNAGTIILAELYGRGVTPYQIDYSIYKETGKIEEFWKSLDIIVDKLRSTEYNVNGTSVLSTEEVEHEETQRTSDEDIN